MQSFCIPVIFFLICFSLSAQSLKTLPEDYPNFLSGRVLKKNFSLSCQKNQVCKFPSTKNVIYNISLNSRSALVSTFMIEKEDANKDITLTYDPDSSSMLITSLFQDCGNKSYLEIQLPKPKKGHSWTQTIPASDSQDCNGALIFVLENRSKSDDADAIYSYQVGSDTSDDLETSTSGNKNLLIKILGPIIAALVLVLMITAYVVYRRRMLRNQRAAMIQRIRQVINQNPDQNSTLNPLNEENLDERFPTKRYEEFTSSFPQTTCSICLEEFKTESPCRQLYCEHIFHSECGAMWLKNLLKKGNAFCPNCNHSMMKQEGICAGPISNKE